MTWTDRLFFLTPLLLLPSITLAENRSFLFVVEEDALRLTTFDVDD